MAATPSLNSSGSGSADIFQARLIDGLLFRQLMSAVLLLGLVWAMVAIIANIVTIIVYRKVGYEDSSNVGLTALALSDLGGGVTTVICVLAIFLSSLPNVKFRYEIFSATGSHPHVMFTRTSALITTYISVERYLCVLLPLKVKHIITTKRTFIAMVIIFVVSIGTNLHLSLKFPVGWVFDSEMNRTVLGVLPVTNPAVLAWHDINLALQSTVLPIFTMITVAVTTILLLTALQKSKTWRDANKTVRNVKNDQQNGKTVSTAHSTVDTKEARAIKMVIAITTVFIISSIPPSMHQLATTTVKEFKQDRRYSNMYTLTGMGFVMIDCMNCSANVFIYYKMSSKFRNALQSVFCNEPAKLRNI